jgi:acetyltransferase-like isoleucine patch superfamily enzyme
MSVIQSDIPSSVQVSDFVHIGTQCIIGENVKIWDYTNMYSCTISDGCMIGSHCEIQSDVFIGENSRIQSHSFICSGTTIGDNVFLSHNTTLINDKFSNEKVNYTSEHWGRIVIEDDVIIGSSCTIMPVKIGKGAIVGANSLVTKNIGENEVWYGNPAKFIKMKTVK